MHLNLKQKMHILKKLNDPRIFQIAFLGLFLLFGVIALEWNIKLLTFCVIISTVVFIQFIGIKKFGISTDSLKSAIISGLGIALLLKANNIETYALAATLSIASKFIIRFKGNHIFNPVNFGIIVTILITNDAWISPGQWGSAANYLFIIGIFSWLVLIKVKQLLNGIIFLGVLFLLNFLYYNIHQGWPLDFVLHKFTNGALLLFSFFMLTDPRTTPKSKYIRSGWSAIIAIASFVLMEFYYISSAPFWVLFFITPLTPILNSFSKSKTFHWK